MIFQKEISRLAERTGVAKSVIDKDWVLGHFLAALYTLPEVKEGLIFKGGTCLRKCWFENYRFSEDLDFTARSGHFALTEKQLEQVCEHLDRHAGIQTHLVSLRPLRFQDTLTGYEAVIKYWGADHPRNEAPPPPERWQTKIKVEVILYEELVFAPIERGLSHPYSDSLISAQLIPCYAIEEVLSEKIRALIQRSYTAPRDYYDIWYLARHTPDLNWERIVRAFHTKMKFKGLSFQGVDELINPTSDRAVRLAWRNSLGHQIPANALPDFDTVKAELTGLFERIFTPA
jgi:predicted nucleotidyltransferase component of viral defense system